MDKTPLRMVALGLLSACAACSGSQSGVGEAQNAGGASTQGGQSPASSVGTSGGAGSNASSSLSGDNASWGSESGGAPATHASRASGGVTIRGSTRQSSAIAIGGAQDSGSTGGASESGGTGVENTSLGGAVSTGGTRSAAGGTRASATGGTVGGAATAGGAANGGTATAASGSSNVATSGVPSPGCGKTPTLKSGSRTIQSGGQARQFMLSIPENYDKNHPYRLVFAFHWNGGTMGDVDGGGSSGDAWSYYGLREQANNSTIFLAPQGIGNGWANSGGRDLKLVDDLIALIEGDLCVDTTQLFSLGFSYGGGMTYELACARASVFRAVAVYSGAQLSGCDGGKQPVAYLGIHGVSDGTCNIGGGRGLRDTFVKNNGCTAQNPAEPAAGSRTHVCTKYQGCSSGHPVEWCAFDGGHTPGNVDGGGDDGAKTWTKGEVWKFFTQFQ
ncbi:MAG: hypothetical protein ACM3ZE_05090 [Myxococcales bacterium]